MAVVPGAATVHELIHSRRFEEIANLCDSLELEYAARGCEQPEDWPYAIHLLGLIYNSDLNNARFLWKRTPSAVKNNNPELASAWKIGQCMWNRDHAAVHEAIRGFEWSPYVRQVVNAVSENFTKRTFELLSRAYSTLSITDAAAYFGLTESEVLLFAEQEGWIVDTNSQMFNVRPVTAIADKKLDSSNLQNLTQYVFHLEH